MNSTDSILLNRLFTRNTLRQVLDEGGSKAIDDAIRLLPQNKQPIYSNRDLFAAFYQFLKKHYRNEYFYKNTLLSKLLLAHKSPHTIALTELPIAKSKADFVLINGKAVVYEIKTPLDNLERLKDQLKDYYKAFSRVAVVTDEKHAEHIESHLDNPCTGIYAITTRGYLKRVRDAQEYTADLSLSVMFKILRKAEYEHILMETFHRLPEVSMFKYYRECKRLFEMLAPAQAYQLFTDRLKTRMTVDLDSFRDIPEALRFLAYFSQINQKDHTKLQGFLEQRSETCISQSLEDVKGNYPYCLLNL